MPAKALVTQKSVIWIIYYVNQRQRKEIIKIQEYCIKLFKHNILDELVEFFRKSELADILFFTWNRKKSH